MYFVVECTTTSAPNSSGRCTYGVAKVLSTASSASCSRARPASAAMSAMPSSGLVGVSHQISRVCGRIAARTWSRSPSQAGVKSSPHRSSTRAKSRNVPPYASFGITTWSPGPQTAWISAVSAASPEAKAKPWRPPSNAARHCSSAVRVGFAERLYSYPPRSPPTPSCLYVDV